MLKFSGISPQQGATGWWLSGSRHGTNGVWVWYKHNGVETIHHTDWSQGEPNNSGGRGEDCIELKPSQDYRWNDLACSDMNAYICELIPQDILIG